MLTFAPGFDELQEANRADRSAGTGGVRSPASGEWQRFGDSNRSQAAGPSDERGPGRTGNAGSYRQPSSNYSGNSGSRSYQSPAQDDRRNGGAQSYRSSPSSGQSSSPGYSAPRAGGASAPRSYSAPSQSCSANFFWSACTGRRFGLLWRKLGIFGKPVSRGRRAPPVVCRLWGPQLVSARGTY